jgi:hypothetical protein
MSGKKVLFNFFMQSHNMVYFQAALGVDRHSRRLQGFTVKYQAPPEKSSALPAKSRLYEGIMSTTAVTTTNLDYVSAFAMLCAINKVKSALLVS